jgi:thiol peroxidase
MAKILFKGKIISTMGDLPEPGSKVPDFTLTKTDMSDVGLSGFSGKKIVMNIFPSIDTSVCATSVRRFNALASNHPDTVVLCISADLPYAQKRFCGAEGLKDVVSLSTFRHPEFGEAYGVRILDGPMAGLMSRAIVVVNVKGLVVYAQQVPDIGQEPDYESALNSLKD